jgi:hypothetical protein
MAKTGFNFYASENSINEVQDSINESLDNYNSATI